MADINQAEEKTAALLSALWLRNRPLIEERLATLDRAAAAAATGTLITEQREQAADNAHKLAGSLGMYGYDQGTKVARQIELMLDYHTPDAAQLSVLIAELRATIFPNG